ncbi:MAG: glycosyltransferase [Phycisphaera sp. TMED9]|nr:MAG: glycosyltransferase [Phycisphaera sp. TMED9]
MLCRVTPSLSVVIPVFGSTDSLGELVRRLDVVLGASSRGYEIILIDDGGPAENWSAIEDLASGKPEVRGVRLSRNFGQHQAIAAGFDHADGDITVVMDCDLQDPPEDIPALVSAIRDGAEVAVGFRRTDPASAVRRTMNTAYYRGLSILAGCEIEPNQGTFSAITRPVSDAYRSLGDLDRPYRLVLQWLGFKTIKVPFDRNDRDSGRSSYSFGKLLQLAVGGIAFQSTRLLLLATVAGVFFSAIALLLGLAIGLLAIFGHPAEGWASTIVVVLFLGGLNLLAIGVHGVYLGKVFHQVRGRPLYVVAETVNHEPPELPAGPGRPSDKTS